MDVLLNSAIAAEKTIMAWSWLHASKTLFTIAGNRLDLACKQWFLNSCYKSSGVLWEHKFCSGFLFPFFNVLGVRKNFTFIFFCLLNLYLKQTIKIFCLSHGRYFLIPHTANKLIDFCFSFSWLTGLELWLSLL